MGNPSRVSIAEAEDCDWTFVGEPAFEKAIDMALRKARSRFSDVLVDDADVRQEAVLWLAVRPELVKRARRTGNFKDLAQNIYANHLRPQHIAEAARQDETCSRDELLEED